LFQFVGRTGFKIPQQQFRSQPERAAAGGISRTRLPGLALIFTTPLQRFFGFANPRRKNRPFVLQFPKTAGIYCRKVLFGFGPFPFHVLPFSNRREKVTHRCQGIVRPAEKLLPPVCPDQGEKELQGQNGENTGTYEHEFKLPIQEGVMPKAGVPLSAYHP
jgi:hypothetical protein